MVPPRITLEERDDEQRETRAIVINNSLAWAIVVMLCGAIGSVAYAAFSWGDTFRGIRADLQIVNSRVDSIEGRRPMRDAQITAIEAENDEQSRRLTALEIAVTGIGALRERVDRGFEDLGKRLDRIEP